MAGTLQKLFRSDDFLGVKELSAQFMGKHDPARKFIHVKEPLPVVVDSSQIIHQILWAAKKRRQADARTDLAEVVDSGLIKAYVPEQLRDEVETKIPVLAVEKKIPEEALRLEWVTIQKSLTFVPIAGRKHKRGVRDVKDWPFVKLAKRIDAIGILTHDLDIPAMGATLIPTKTLRKMRDYTRATSVAVGTFVALIIWGILICTLLAPLWDGLVWVCKKVGWVWIVLAVIVLGLIIYFNDRLRNWLTDKFRRAGASIGDGWNSAKPHVNAILDDFAVNRMESRRLWPEIEEELGLPKRTEGRVE